MQHWNLREIDLPHGTRSPVVLNSKEGAERAVLIALRPGEGNYRGDLPAASGVSAS